MPKFKNSNETFWLIFKHCVKVEIELNSFNWLGIKPREHWFRNGTENSELCWQNHIPDLDCDFKCQYQSFATHLPKCQTPNQSHCMFSKADSKNLFTICNSKKKGVTFKGQLSKEEKYDKSDNVSTINVGIYSMSKEVREEVDIITFSELIGSIGGSLGMFFGFSISAYVFYVVDAMIMKAMRNHHFE